MVFVVLFHLYPSITRKRQQHYILEYGLIRTRLGVAEFPKFSGFFFDFFPVNLLLVRSNQAEIIIVKRQGE